MQKTSYFHEIFENIKKLSIVFNTIDSVSFIFHDKKIMFSRKTNVIFLDDAKKIIF